MTTILLVTGSDRVIDTVHAALSDPDTSIIEERDPNQAAKVAYTRSVDAVVVDMQVGSMGAIAVTHAIRDAAIDDAPIPVTILMDRDVDAFTARRSGASTWVAKSASTAELRRAVYSTQSHT